jgi:hypothetical protein
MCSQPREADMFKRVLPFLSILVFLAFGACSGLSENGLPPGAGTFVIQTLTATMWTPTVTPTPDPNTAQIVGILNSAMIASDPLRDTLAAKFEVLDVHFPFDDVAHQILSMQIDVECEWIFTDSCTAEESFASLMHGFVADKKTIEKIRAQVPATVNKLYVTTYNHRVRNGLIIVNWQDVVDFAAGRITGNQLAARITRSGH